MPKLRVALLFLVSFSSGAAMAACGGGSSSSGDGTGADGGATHPSGTDAGGSKNDGSTMLLGGDAAPEPDGGFIGVPGTIIGTIRDFKFYDGTTATNADFENPPYDIDQNGNPSPGYVGAWDDPNIVADTLGADSEPVYKNPNGTPDANGRVTLTTHGKASFDQWFHDTAGMNDPVSFPLPLTTTAGPDGGTEYGYDSEVSGVLYTPGDPSSGMGFFPIDDGTMYGKPNQTTFGNQALTNPPYNTPYPQPTSGNHNYSFTFELHTVFTYNGGEVFDFRGDDDVFVFINKKLVINLGGVHGAEAATAVIDSLGLTVGQQYPLDFFSVERHVVGSNIQFTTTLELQPGPR